MRNIKFRAYAQTDKTWHYWDVYGEYPDGIYGGLSEPQQYTGLKDKNGVEIYEGDIVKRWGNIYIVIWDKIGFRMKWTKEDSVNRFPDELCEVIGNIYENPELLNR